MPRKARIDAPGALHHIIFRGLERCKIFRDTDDRTGFLERLENVLGETHTPCFAWVLMPNHVHLLLRTGITPISTVMQRLLTGHATHFNHRHRRHGKLFQNRYKSILCQENAYFLELVRYIHLNPIRAGLIHDLQILDTWPYSGHSSIMGKQVNQWQDTDYVLNQFDRFRSAARQKYRDYLAKALNQGKRPELTGGGLIRSSGGWSAVKEMRKSAIRTKSDERILGDSDFVQQVLSTANENYESDYALRVAGYDLDKVARRVCQQTGIEMDRLWSKSKHPETVLARSLLCYWACRKLGMKTTDLARRLNMSQPAVSQSVRRGEKLCQEHGWDLLG